MMKYDEVVLHASFPTENLTLDDQAMDNPLLAFSPSFMQALQRLRFQGVLNYR